ncbi:MAG: CDP-diglyceride synthetase [Acidimicrobiales bacterium]|nr:CDP-diglyceride synthetase [Acidimicrobiales bacterium]
MDDQRRSRPEHDKKAPSAEGVRIIGPDEAAQAMERGDVASRRTDDELRYGDRPPPPPAGPRPALRFPLDASADPTRIERPPVQPAPDPVTGPVELPHWTDPPTGEVPAVLIGDDSPLLSEEGEELDAWSSFATSTPRWRDADDDWTDDGFMEKLAGDSGEVRIGALGDQDAEPSHEEYFGFDDLQERVGERTGDGPDAAPSWEAGDDDWSASSLAGDHATGDVPESGGAADGSRREDEEDWVDEPRSDGAPALAGDDDHRAGGYEDPGGYDDPGDHAGERDLSAAIFVGVAMGLVAAVVLALQTPLSAVLVTLVLAMSAAEYFAVLRRVGWEAAQLLGIVTCMAFPLAVYWRGPVAFGLVGFLALVAILAWFLVGASGPDPRVLEGTGATLLGVVWIGGFGSAATAMLRMDDGTGLLLIAILAAVGHDMGGLFIGKAMGHRPISAASPNKTLEGLVGGMAVAAVIAIAMAGILKIGPWTGFGAALALGLGVAVAAPLGDLCQSLLKRDLGVKDMSSLIPGHGGVLDRFDSMLFVLPTVFWLAVTLGHVG